MTTITSLRPGQRARIVDLKPGNVAALRKFIAFGLMPGAMVEVIQVSPVYVLQIDFTQVALDKQAASGIIVTR